MTNNPVYHFFHTPGNAGPFLLRLAVAAIFFFHNAQKTLGWFGGTGWQGTVEAWTAHTGLGLPYIFVLLSVLVEFLVCPLLFFGLLTRLAGIGVVVIMSGALIILAQNSVDFTDYELPLLLWTAGASLFFLGGGALSVDRAISRNLLPVVG